MVVSVESEKLKATVTRKPMEGDVDEMYRLTKEGKGTIISDAFQANHQLKLGDVIELPTPSGILSLPVVGIIRDYSDMQGALFIDRERVRQELEGYDRQRGTRVCECGRESRCCKATHSDRHSKDDDTWSSFRMRRFGNMSSNL